METGTPRLCKHDYYEDRCPHCSVASHSDCLPCISTPPGPDWALPYYEQDTGGVLTGHRTFPFKHVETNEGEDSSLDYYGPGLRRDEHEY